MDTVYTCSHWHDSCSTYHFRIGVGQFVSGFVHAIKHSSLSGQMQWQIQEDVTEYLTSEKLTETGIAFQRFGLKLSVHMVVL